MKFTDQKFRWFAFTIGISIFIYVLSRAINLSITHDEVGTTDVLQIPVWDVMFSERCFQSANNHVLNSLLMKLSAALFGTSELALRLPNVLSYIFFFLGSYIVVCKSTSDNYLRICGIIILNTVLYQLDFFSLARGYGLANSFEMFSLGMLFLYFDKQQMNSLFYTFLFAALAVYANFTWLLFFVGLWVTFNFMIIIQARNLGNSIRQIIKLNIIPFGFSVLLTCLCYKPISILKHQDEFRWGAVSLSESLRIFSNDILYRTENIISPYIRNVILLIIILSLITTCLLLYKKQKWSDKGNAFIVAISSLMLIIISATICQHYILGTQYIDGRKATLYFSLVMSILFLLLVQFKKLSIVLSYLLAFSISVLCIWHFFEYKNNQSVREWWFDGGSREIATYIVEHPVDGNCNTAIHWKYYPSILFYNQFVYNSKIKQLVKFDEINSSEDFAYYYVEGDEIRNVPIEFSPLGKRGEKILLVKDMLSYSKMVQQIGEDSLKFLRKNINWSELPELKMK